MQLLDLFSGIGGFSLGLERAGFRTVAFCEIAPFCRRVLAKHWPKVPIYDDVRQLSAARLAADGIGRIDAICGGFPCQDISTAGKGAGLDGERSGLWREFARLIGELRPRVALVENVGALRGRGLAAILADLAALGYDAQWHAIPAAAVGAPHLRDRIWIVAANADTNSATWGRNGENVAVKGNGGDAVGAGSEKPRRLGDAADADDGFQWWRMDAAARDRAELGGRSGDTDGHDGRKGWPGRLDPATAGKPVAERALQGAAANTDSAIRQRLAQHAEQQGTPRCEPDGLGARGRWHGQTAPEPERERRTELRGLFGPLARALAAASAPWPRTAEPPLCGLDDGLPARLARPRLRALGNAVVPQIPEIIGRAVLEAAL